MVRQRVEASTAIEDYLKTKNWDAITNDDDLDSLEDVLGFFDELGYYWHNDEISSDVLYEHFYDYLRTYYQETDGYVRMEQKEDSTEDFEYVGPLFSALTQMEAKRTGKTVQTCKWNTNLLIKSLKTEKRLQRK